MKKSTVLIIAIFTLIAACNLPAGNEQEIGPIGQIGSTVAEGSAQECPGPERHLFGESIAETFDVSYEQVMTWFCDGNEFIDILLALQTSEGEDISAGELLEMRKTMTWEEIWDETGVFD